MVAIWVFAMGPTKIIIKNPKKKRPKKNKKKIIKKKDLKKIIKGFCKFNFF